jgi:methoxymalonate biosynthesis acyl carrier protein
MSSAPPADQTRTKTAAFFARYCNQPGLQDGDDIFAGGFVTSLVAMQLVRFLEKEFSIVIEDEDLEMDNFKTIGNICSFVARKRVGREPADA